MNLLKNSLVALFALLLASSFSLPSGAYAAPSDPAAQQIEAFDNALLDVMKNAKTLGIQGRYKKLAPVIDQTFNLRAMTSLAVGSYWTNFSEPDRQKAIAAFRNYTIANYASNFDGYSGQRFELNPEVVVRSGDKIVRTQIVKDNGKDPTLSLRTGDKPVNLTYRMHETSGKWQVVDIYYLGSISQLSMQRSEFSATLASGGADALIKKLNELSANLLKGKS